MKKTLLSLCAAAMVTCAWADVTINVDDASKVKVMDSSYTYLELQDGANTAAAGYYMIQPSTYDYAVNKVSLNGQEVSETYGYWSINLVDDDVLDITALYDAESYTVTINAPADAISSVTAAGEPVEDYSQSFQAPAGYTLLVTPNTNAYKIESVSINGEAMYYYSGTISISIKGETTIDIVAEEKSMNQFVINVSDPAAVSVYGAMYSSYYDSNCPISLVSTENNVQLAEDYSYIAVMKNAGYFITSVSVDGVSCEESWGTYYVPVTNGSVVDVVCGAIALDQTATIVVKDRAAANYSFSFMNVDYETIDLEEGVNTLDFSASYNPFAWGCYGDAIAPVVYINGVEVAPSYEGGTYFSGLELADGDYVELFVLGGASEYHTVGLSQVDAADQEAIHSLYGQRVNNMQQGIYVVGGRKVIVK